MARRTLSSCHPWLYWARVRQRQTFRAARWRFGSEEFARSISREKLPCKIYRHQSKLRRYLSEDRQDIMWQDNKVHNHSLAVPYIDGVLIRPGQTFSFWRLVGKPTQARGFKEGMELSMGSAQV